jgi:ABC-type antimicrobial peptide transport system permease subunit
VATLSAWFAAVALLLACVGLYGVIAYNVARRKREIGLRIALGAIPSAILRHVFREALLIAAVGIVLGLPLALAALRLLETLLFDLAPHDLTALAASVGALLLVAVVAGVRPARRAATTDPVEALRDR